MFFAWSRTATLAEVDKTAFARARRRTTEAAAKRPKPRTKR